MTEKPLLPENDPENRPFWIDGRKTGVIEYYREKTTRTTKCRICELQILKGQVRIRSVQRLRGAYVVKSSNGGLVYKDLRFYHPKCLEGLFKTPTPRNNKDIWTSCFLCKQPVTRSVPRPGGKPHAAGPVEFAGYHRSRYGSVPVCTKCSALLFSCDHCNMWVEGSRATPRTEIEERKHKPYTVVRSNYYCYTCVDKYELKDSLRWQKREERAAKRVAKQYEEIKENLKKNGV